MDSGPGDKANYNVLSNLIQICDAV